MAKTNLEILKEDKKLPDFYDDELKENQMAFFYLVIIDKDLDNSDLH